MIFRRNTRKKSLENPEDNIEIYGSLEKNLKILQEQFKDCADIVMNRLKNADGRNTCILHVDGLIDSDIVQRDVVAVLLRLHDKEINELKESNVFPTLRKENLYSLEQVIDSILRGSTVILIDGICFGVSFNITKFEKRTIEEPEVERIIKGQHEGFIESVYTNIALIRRKVVSTKLKVKIMVIGKRSKTDVAVIYIEDIANPEIVKRVEKRLESIEIDNINGAGYIEQLTSDSIYSPFPQYQATERPDKAVANLMEGRVVLLVDNTPVSLILPVDYFQFFQTSEDYNINWYFGSFLRFLRFTGVFIAVLFPALYIAILTYHYQAVPLSLLVPLAESRSRVPFPPIIEALIMELSFELLREASIRLPSSLGPTIGIVGGLVIGQTAVQAGIVSNIMVIVVGITAIATFVVPAYDVGLLLRLSRFIAMINAAVFGVVGVVMFILIVLAHMVTLESYGQPYLQPLAPFKLNGMKDSFIIRAPLKAQRKRPEIALPKDKSRGRGNNEGR